MPTDDRALFDLIRPVVAGQGMELVEVSLVRAGPGSVLRVVIHSEAGVTHGDCARVTSELGRVLEEDGPVRGFWRLEVGSPGTTRVLKAPREFEVFRGRAVKVRLAEPPGTEIRGTAAGTEGEGVRVRRPDGSEELVEWARIAKAKLDPEPPGEGGASGRRGKKTP